MSQITAYCWMGWSLPWMRRAQSQRTRAKVVRQAVEYYLDDFEDISCSIEVLRDPADPVLDWEAVMRDLLRQPDILLISIPSIPHALQKQRQQVAGSGLAITHSA